MMERKDVPRLRFSGFEGNWDVKKLGDVGDVKMCKRIFNEQTTDSGEIPFFKIGSFGKKADAFITRDLYNEFRNKFSFPTKGDVLISAAGTIGRLVVYNGEDAYFQDSNIVWLDNDQSFMSNEFLYYILGLAKFNTEGGTVQRLYNSILKATTFSHPKLNEQRKITNFMSAIDSRLHILQKKKALLEKYKKGMMQKIFNQEIRFKDENGKDFKDWEEKRLDEIAIKQSSNISANKIEENFGDYIIYGASGILKKVDFYQEESDYISIVKDGAGVGRLLYCQGLSSVLGTMDIIKPIPGLNTYFLYCLLSIIDFVQYISGSTIPHIYFKNYAGEICGVPSLNEQIKIANFLSAIDDKINLVAVQIEKMEKFKKGLLGEMFV